MASSINGTHSTVDVMKLITGVLQATDQYGLQVEVLATAFIYLKENPEASIEEALNVGLGDWDV